MKYLHAIEATEIMPLKIPQAQHQIVTEISDVAPFQTTEVTTQLF